MRCATDRPAMAIRSDGNDAERVGGSDARSGSRTEPGSPIDLARGGHRLPSCAARRIARRWPSDLMETTLSESVVAMLDRDRGRSPDPRLTWLAVAIDYRHALRDGSPVDGHPI